MSAIITTFTLAAAAVSNPVSAIENGVYRFLNTKTGAHFFTSSFSEAQSVAANLRDFAYEGGAFLSSGTDMFYRFFNKLTGTHFYTASATERDSVQANLGAVYTYEGTAYNVSASADYGGQALYRFYNPSTAVHFYTASASERDTILNTLPGYKFEGVAAYVNNQVAQAPVTIPQADPTGRVTTSGILPNTNDPRIEGGGTISLTIPANHTVLQPGTVYGYTTKSINTFHTGSLTLDASASNSKTELSVYLGNEAFGSTSTVIFGPAARIIVDLGKGSDTIHLGGATQQSISVHANTAGGSDRVTGLRVGDGLALYDTPYTLTRDTAGNIVVDYAGDGAMTLVGVFNVSTWPGNATALQIADVF